ncbi:acyl-CoA thioesterase [Lentzea sp. CA-135723]|uniref:acyl-CoA thioesterase n=1 Tax=Lentzea sp. CA-135723 TaxID=3239950 RepID=UPI003D914C5F
MNDVWSGYSFTPRFYEIDSQGVMFYMWYLGHADEAMAAFFTDRGLPYDDWRSLGFDVHVVHTDLDFAAGVRPHDVVEVLVSPSRIGTKSFTLDFAFRRDGETVCSGGLVYATVSADGRGAIALPARLVEMLGEVRPIRPSR